MSDPRSTRTRPAVIYFDDVVVPPEVARPVRPPRPPIDVAAWATRIGVGSLAIGAGIGLDTAVARGWLGPRACIGLGALAAVAAVGSAAVARRRGHTSLAHGLTALAVSLLYLVAWASCTHDDLLTRPEALVAMTTITIASALLAVRYRAQAIAVLASIGGLAAPLVLWGGDADPALDLGQLMGLTVGAVVLARRQCWPALLHVAGFGAVLVFGAWLARDPDHAALATACAAVLYGALATARSRPLWFVSQLAASCAAVVIWRPDAPLALPCVLAFAAAGLITSERHGGWGACAWTLACATAATAEALVVSSPADDSRDLVCVTGMLLWFVVTHARAHRHAGAHREDRLVVFVAAPAAYLAGACHLVDTQELAGLAVAIAVLYSLLAVWLSRRVGRDAWSTQLAVTVSAAAFAAAAAIQLSCDGIALTCAVEGALLAWRSRDDTNRRLAILAAALLAIAGLAIAGTFDHYDAPIRFVNARFAALVALSIGACGFSTRRDLDDLPMVAGIAGHVILIAAVALELDPSLAKGVDSRFEMHRAAMAWTASYGLVWMVRGFVRGRRSWRVAGFFVLLATTCLFGLVEVWHYDDASRIVSLLILGALFVAVSWLFSRPARIGYVRTLMCDLASLSQPSKRAADRDACKTASRTTSTDLD